MTLSFATVTFDCRDPRAMARFWSEALDLQIDRTAEHEALIGNEGQEPWLLFLTVPEGKTSKNRLHLDLNSDDRQADVRRLVARGASERETIKNWTVMLDVEGNEFCVLSPR